MPALIVGLAFGSILLIGGAGFARHLDHGEPPVSLGAAAILAGFVILAGDGSALIGYSAGMALASSTALVAAVWAWPREINLPGLWAQIRGHRRLASMLAVSGLALTAPLLVLPVPFDTDAQGFGYLSLMMRDGGSINSLAPWHPEIAYLYSPGALLVFASLSKVFTSVPMSAVMMGTAHVVTLLFVWLAWEFGREVGLMAERAPALSTVDSRPRSEKWAGVMAVSAALSVGLWTALMDSHYTAIFALVFALACLTGLFRFLRTAHVIDLMLAALMFAGVLMTQPDMAIILALGLGSFSVLAWLAVDRPSFRSWLLASVGIPIVAAALVSPWLVSIWPLVTSGIQSPFKNVLSGWQVAILYHGLIWPVLALVGAAIYLRLRQTWVLMMVGWLVLAFDFGITGFLPQAFPALIAPLIRFSFPFSISWHAPIIPYMALGAGTLVWITDRIDRQHSVERLAFPAMTAATVGIVLAVIFSNNLLALSKGWPGPYGAFASANDVLAMRWLHDHTPSDARVLNYPGDYENQRDWEAHWAAVLAERDCVYFRMQPFFVDTPGSTGGISKSYTEQQILLAFWRDPADTANATLLHEAGIDYVLVPESVGDPASLAQSWRWKPPALLPDTRSTPQEAPYLRLVFSAGGAQVYQVQP
jgi:hypothetical protein